MYYLSYLWSTIFCQFCCHHVATVSRPWPIAGRHPSSLVVHSCLLTTPPSWRQSPLMLHELLFDAHCCHPSSILVVCGLTTSDSHLPRRCRGVGFCGAASKRCVLCQRCFPLTGRCKQGRTALWCITTVPTAPFPSAFRSL